MKNNNLKILHDLRSDYASVRNRMLSQLYLDYFPVIRSFIMDNSGDVSEAEDVFQDAMVVFYTKVRNPEFKLNCQAKTYIYSVSKNLWLNKLKSKDRFSLMDTKLEFIDIPNEAFEVLNLDSKYGKVMKHFSKMGTKCRDVLYHFYFHRMSMHSIAEEMGFANEQVAKNKKSRCLSKLKEMVFNNTTRLPNESEH